MIIREAVKNDITAWSQMRTDLWPDTDDQHVAAINEYFLGSSNDIVKAWMAVSNAEVIGFLELNIRSFAEGSRSKEIPYIEAWYIKPAYRGNSYGALLMQQAEQWAVSCGYSELASDTQTDNDISIAMHKHLGFFETDRIVCFLKRLKNA
ncbi:MAG: GNAT family N-acetyltransferase [Gammaproteobacteria bacterium]|nr:GNAT family N-acetyltransferase [Gammaproteobacteria bacterium]